MKESFFPKEVLVVTVGVALIAGTLALTLLRPDTKPKTTTPETFSESSEATKFFQEVTYVQSEKLQKDVLTGSLLILDLRDSGVYQISHVPESLSATPDTVVALFKSKNPAPQKVVLIDEAGQTPTLKTAIENLRTANIKNIVVLAGGYSSWNTKAYQTVSWGDPDSILDHSKVHAISVENTKKLLNDKQVVFLDIRSKEAYNKDHKAGSLNIPLDALETSVNQIPKTQMIIAYGENPLESFQGGVRLYDLGFLLVYTLNGGYIDLK